MKELSKSQLKYLRKVSQKEKPLFQIGKNGVTDIFIEQIDAAIEKRELVKFKILQNSDETIKEAANQIAEGINAVIVHLIGATAVLYRPSSKEKDQRLSQEVNNID